MKKVKKALAIGLIATALTMGVASSVSAGSWLFCSYCGEYIGYDNPHACVQ